MIRLAHYDIINREKKKVTGKTVCAIIGEKAPIYMNMVGPFMKNQDAEGVS